MGSIAPDSTVVRETAVPSTTACFSRSAQICSSAAAVAQMPSPRGHSRRLTFPMTTEVNSIWQRGHGSGGASATSVRSALAPQWAIAEHVLLIFDHDPEIGMGYLHNDSGRYWVETIG